eukprot:scaffold227810_cov20-Tisochrysis_lutea.AAC.2
MDKEDQELNVMRGQSSSWFFIEELNIGMLSVNVTLSLDSNVNFSGGVGLDVLCMDVCEFTLSRLGRQLQRGWGRVSVFGSGWVLRVVVNADSQDWRVLG